MLYTFMITLYIGLPEKPCKPCMGGELLVLTAKKRAGFEKKPYGDPTTTLHDGLLEPSITMKRPRGPVFERINTVC